MWEADLSSLLRSVVLTFFEWSDVLFPYWPYITVLVTTILLIYVCYCANEGGIHYVATERIPIIMRKVINPFTFDVSLEDTNSPDIKCSFSTQKDCYILPFWGVPGSDFFEMLKMDWVSMKYTLMQNHNTFRSKCLAASPITRLADGQKSLVFRPPSSLHLDEIIDQRLFLPCVIVMLLAEEAIENIEEPFVFIQAAIVNVPAIFKNIKIRNVRTRESSVPYNIPQRIPTVLGIYVKESHSTTIGVVKRVYDGSLYSENVNGDDIPICVACCQRTVNTVIFPCLHASLCTLCYLQCEICPSCRGPAFYYFTIGPLTEIPQEDNLD